MRDSVNLRKVTTIRRRESEREMGDPKRASAALETPVLLL